LLGFLFDLITACEGLIDRHFNDAINCKDLREGKASATASVTKQFATYNVMVMLCSLKGSSVFCEGFSLLLIIRSFGSLLTLDCTVQGKN